MGKIQYKILIQIFIYFFLMEVVFLLSLTKMIHLCE